MHVHVEREQNEAKFWLNPVVLARSEGFRRHEINELEKLVIEHQQQLIERWHGFFGD
jgi:hypothetical protein